MTRLLPLILIFCVSCTRYQFVAIPSKITIEGDKVWTREIGKRVVLTDTTITGTTIHKVRVKWWEKRKVVHGGKL